MIWRTFYTLGAITLSIILIAAVTRYNYSLGTDTTVLYIPFLEYNITSSYMWGAMGFAFAILMVTSFIGIFYWRNKGSHVSSMACVAVWIVCSLFDVNSLYGFIKTDILQSAAPQKNANQKKKDIDVNLKSARARLDTLNSVVIEGTTWRAAKARRDHQERIDKQQARVDSLTEKKNNIKDVEVVSPAASAAWGLAIILWCLHAFVWKGAAGGGPPGTRQRSASNNVESDVHEIKHTHDNEKINNNNVVDIQKTIHACNENNSLQAFINRNLTQPMKASALYEKYCKDGNREAYTLTSFGKAMSNTQGVTKTRHADGMYYAYDECMQANAA